MICLVLAIPFTALTVAQLYDGSLLGAWCFAAITVVLLLCALFQGVGRQEARYNQQLRDELECRRVRRLLAGDEETRQWQIKHQQAARRLRDIPPGRRPGEMR